MSKKDARVIATITEDGIVVQLFNWDGVSNVMIERVHYAVIQQSQRYRAGKLGEVHKERMEAEAAARKEALNVEPEGSEDKFAKEMENVLKK